MNWIAAGLSGKSLAASYFQQQSGNEAAAVSGKGSGDALPSAQRTRVNTRVHNHLVGEGRPALSGSLKLEAGAQFLATILGKVRPGPAALGDTWVRSADSAARAEPIHRPPTQTRPGPRHCPLVAGLYVCICTLKCKSKGSKRRWSGDWVEKLTPELN